jgi:hypothetical protein
MASKAGTKDVPTHPPYAEMVCEALVTLDETGVEKHHGHGLSAIKKAIEDKYKLRAGWEKRLNHVVKMMVDKHQLDHMPGHLQTYKMSADMKHKMERKEMTEHKGEEAGKAKAPKKKMVKGKSPAKRAKKADMPKAKKMQEAEA